MRSKKYTHRIVTILVVSLLAFGLGFATDADVEDEAERAENAAAVFSEIMEVPDHEIPAELLEEAEAIAVVPHVVKGAFVVGGKYGKGLISQRNKDGNWSAPSYVSLSGASVGFQIGASATDYIFVFTNREGLKPLLKGKVKLGADASVAAGPVGRTASASTDVTLNSAIYSYSRSKGAFAGVALDGAVLSIDDSANEKVYGHPHTGEEILLDDAVSVNSATAPFNQALQTYMP